MPLFLLLLFFCATLSAQTPSSPPTLPPAAQAHLPKGWKLLELVSADLNSDGRADLVFVREEQDPKKVKRDRDISPDVQNYNPRVLTVLIAEPAGYRKIVECEKLIPPAFDLEFSAFDDRFDGISAEKGVLTVKFRYWASGGYPWISLDGYKFRLEAGRLRLIGREADSFHRATGNKNLTSINHLTGKMKLTSGLNEFNEDESKPVVTWKTLPSRKPIYIEDLPPCALEQ